MADKDPLHGYRTQDPLLGHTTKAVDRTPGKVSRSADQLRKEKGVQNRHMVPLDPGKKATGSVESGGSGRKPRRRGHCLAHSRIPAVLRRISTGTPDSCPRSTITYAGPEAYPQEPRRCMAPESTSQYDTTVRVRTGLLRGPSHSDGLQIIPDRVTGRAAGVEDSSP